MSSIVHGARRAWQRKVAKVDAAFSSLGDREAAKCGGFQGHKGAVSTHPFGPKVSPMSPERSVTYVSGTDTGNIGRPEWTRTIDLFRVKEAL